MRPLAQVEERLFVEDEGGVIKLIWKVQLTRLK
jgi:hypothetical protein